METLRRLLEIIDGGGACVLATVSTVRGSAPRGPGTRMLVAASGERIGTVGGGGAEERAIEAALHLLESGERIRTLEIATTCGGVVTLLLERFAAPRRLLVVGAGHVGRAVAEAALRAGFAVSLLDRPAAFSRGGVAAATMIEADDPAALDAIPDPAAAHVVVATGSHEVDVAWTVAAVGRGFASVGLLGSASKAAAARAALLRAGLEDGRLRCPVGLDLGAVTPAEIAVAVVAELIVLERRGEVPPTWRKPSPA